MDLLLLVQETLGFISLLLARDEIPEPTWEFLFLINGFKLKFPLDFPISQRWQSSLKSAFRLCWLGIKGNKEKIPAWNGEEFPEESLELSKD